MTHSGAVCTESSPTVRLGIVTCPTAGLQATRSAAATSYNVSLTFPLFSASQFTSFASLRLVFVPEPSILLLLGAAGIGLVLAGRRGRSAA